MIPVSQTLPDVNLDEILASLDADTRDYLLLLSTTAREGLGSERKGRELAQAIRRLEPTAKYAREINEGLAERRENLARVVHNFSLLTNELGKRDTQLANFVQNSNAVFATLAEPGRVAAADPAAACRARCRPRRRRWARSRRSPTCSGRRSRRCGPPRARSARRCARRGRSCAESTPIIRDEIRPFTRAALPTVKELRPAMRDLAAATPDLTRSFKVVNRLLNAVAYNPPGSSEEGYLFWQCVGQPRRQLALLHRGRARPDPPRPVPALLHSRRSCWTRSPRPTRSSARSSRCSTRRAEERLPSVPAGPGGRRRHGDRRAAEPWSRTLPPSARSRRWCCSR